MNFTILIPLFVTLVAFQWVRGNVRSSGMGGLIELAICGGAAIILSLGAWLAWALIMWGLS